MRRLALLAVAIMLLADGARADPDASERVRLALERGAGAEGCPAEAELGRRVAARLGRDPFADGAPRVVHVRVTRTSADFRAEIRVLDASGHVVATREPLESTASDCMALADAIVLAVALSIDPEAALGAPTPAEPPAPVAPPACPSVDCAPPVCPSCPPPPPVERSTRARAALRGVGAIGVLPAPAPGVALAVEVEAMSSLWLGAAMFYLPEVQTDDGELAFGLTTAELFACPRLLGNDGAGLLACGGVQLGSLHAVAHGLRPIEPGDYPWLAATVGARGVIEPAPGLSLELGAEGVAPLIAHEFVVRGREGVAHEPATIGVFGWLGVGIAMP